MKPFEISSLQPHAWSILARSFLARKVASTYLFSGEEGIGQWLLALNLAALLNCESPKTADQEGLPAPCGSCRACRLIFAGSFEGLHLIVPITKHKNHEEAIQLTSELLALKQNDPFTRLVPSSSSLIPISLAREVSNHLSRKAPDGMTRIVLFYRMDRMRIASSDALLKLIEEPPPNTVIVLTSDRVESLSQTIQSRAQKIRLNRLSGDFIQQHLMDQYDLGSERARLLARLSEGVAGRAIEWADEEEDDELSRRQMGAEIFGLILSGNKAEAIAKITENIKPRDRASAEKMLFLWQSLLRDCHFLSVVGEPEDITNSDLIDTIKSSAQYLRGSGTAQSLIGQIKNTLADFERSVHIHNALAALSLRMQESLAPTL